MTKRSRNDGTLRGPELVRVRFLFLALGIVPLFLTGWLGYLQVAQAGELSRGEGKRPLRLIPAAAEEQRHGEETLPAPRGTIYDRHGAALAIDCDAWQVRARVVPPARERATLSQLTAWLDGVASDLVAELVRDDEIADRVRFRRDQRKAILDRLEAAFHFHADPPVALPASVDVLVTTRLCSAEASAGLRALDERRDSLKLHWLRTHERVYPERDATWGLVGFEEAMPAATPSGGLTFERAAKGGIERTRVLQAGEDGSRSYEKNAALAGYWTGNADLPSPPSRLYTTVDLELQKYAARMLEQEALAVGKDGKTRLPQWGALVLVEVASGDVLAAASWNRDAKVERGMAFTPYQFLYEPGSIVKPLVFAWALQFAGLDWHRNYDCSSSGKDHLRVVEETGRPVRDDHPCGPLTPAGILVNSSNIGAVKVGSLLDRAQWRAYYDFFGFGTTLGIGLPYEKTGGCPKVSFDPKVPASQFRKYTASSFSIGYELQVNAMQMARAYLSLVSGRSRGLRLFQAAEVDGNRIAAPAVPVGQQQFSPAVVDLVMAAMTDVISSEPLSTGRVVHALMLKEEGIDVHGLIAGKTGTAKVTANTGRGSVEMRNASFVGILPAEQPRYLAVCILQRDDDARFYGGSYAAPPVARLLLQAQKLEQRRRLRTEPQVRVTPGVQAGPGRAPETRETGGK